MSHHDDAVAQIRRLNRTVTQRAGVLGDRYLERNRPLGASRVLWEIGLEGAEVRALRARLDLDSGQLSRTLRTLEDAGLIALHQSDADRRVRFARLTARGHAERAVLDRRSDVAAEALLGSLSADQQTELVEAMRVVERLLTKSTLRIRAVDPGGPDARRCLRAYFAELDRRADRPFDPTKGSPAEPTDLRGTAGSFLVAYLHDAPIGCGAVKHPPGAPSEIKRMWVAESARGLGIGRLLLEHLEQLARERGCELLRLETNRALVEAIALYRSAGYEEVAAFNREPFADHWFAKQLRPRA
jgi:GNAT superfamily N-acetyltransferase/DNA-binding HxlR family transcriptional regulator